MNYEYDNLTHRELADRVITINTKSGYIPNLALTPSPSPKLGRGEPEPEAMAKGFASQRSLNHSLRQSPVLNALLEPAISLPTIDRSID
jgi:hypothetical protein